MRRTKPQRNSDGGICGDELLAEENTVAARCGSRFIALTIVAFSAVALCVPAANADLLGLGSLLGGNCPTSGTQVFAPWQDLKHYYLAPNGGLENGSTGWSLSGG